jgi:pimeloyl-ACP methyl ester carboxylesterase
MRGYAPSSLSSDGSYHVGAYMDDALRVLQAAGPTGRDVLVGHDWGAIAGAGLSAMPDSPFTKAVIMSVPFSAAFRPFGRVPQAARLAAKLPRQLLLSWYIAYFQLPWLPERSARWVIPRLWRKWSPSYRADEDLRYVDEAIGSPERWRAALGFYRATVRGTRPPAQYSEFNKHWLQPPRLPTLYLHGTDDGCSEDYTPWIERVLPAESEVALVTDGGHFLQLDQPDVVARHIVDFVGKPRVSSARDGCARLIE